ncbi:hypothetical protein [Bacillus sp. 03113]|uniref:hypothetical protein n=1 Tax=Bacillus sp. 03113 TaxID=2578211 RepID=UPI0015E89C18|nr:hypothetical protein [Bacillus sp. 03113]
MPKKSTKYQLLQDDFHHATAELRKYYVLIKELREEIEELKVYKRAYEAAMKAGIEMKK